MPSLYVFLHGLCVIQDTSPNPLNVILPDVSGHVYRAGNWLAETDIDSGATLELKGVTPGNKGFRGQPYVIDRTRDSLQAQYRAATIILPRPRQIWGLLRGIPSPPYTVLVTTNDNPPESYTDLATVLVLAYDYTNESQVFLENHTWEPYAVGGSISLHIVCTSELFETKAHEMDTDNVLRGVIKGYKGSTWFRAMAPDWHYLTASLPKYGDLTGLRAVNDRFVDSQNGFAFMQAQLEDYGVRVQRMALLGRLAQEGIPLQSIWDLPAPLGAHVANCVGYVVP